MNLILVALPGPELYFLADFIKKNYSVNVVSIEKDLCKDESCIEVFNEVNALRLKVNMLINNAGLGSTSFFAEGSTNLYEKQIKLNVLATTIMTRIFFEQLKQNGPSYILNVGSMASFFYLPKKLVYSATKSFIYVFSKNLHKELKKDNIHVSVLCPGGMNTNLQLTLMNKTGNYVSRLSILNPENVAPLAIAGLLNNKGVIIPGKLNRFLILLESLLPWFVKRMLINGSVNKMNPENLYTRYLSKPMVIA